MKKNNPSWILLFVAIIVLGSSGQIGKSFGGDNATSKTEDKPDKYVNYLENARSLLNQSSFEYKNGNYTGAEELVTAAYLDNFEYVEDELEKKASHSFMQDIEHKMREDLRDLIKNRVELKELDVHINATDARLADAINLLNINK